MNTASSSLTLRLAIPNGSLEQGALKLLRNVSPELVQQIEQEKRRLSFERQVNVSGLFCNLSLIKLRPQEIPKYLGNAKFDLGITGYDCVLESGRAVPWLNDLAFSRASSSPVRWVVAVPEESSIKSLSDLSGKRIASEIPKTTRRLFDNLKIPNVIIDPSIGATEGKVPYLADAILEASETGSSIVANKLRIVAEVFQSRAGLYARPGLRDDLSQYVFTQEFVMKMLRLRNRIPDIRFDRSRRGNLLLRKVAKPSVRRINFKKYPGNIVPAIIQDYDTGEVLMEGWMNKGAVIRTLRGPYVTFWSRSRNEYWLKGATSGDYLKFVEMKVDCDGDALLVKVIPCGATCHTKAQSCF